MFSDNRYVTVMTSLPHPGSLFKSKQTPCSRYTLDARLSMLDDTDADVLKDVEDLLQWSHQPISRSDEEIVANAKTTMDRLTSATLRDVVLSRLELRTTVAALRRRKRGDSAPKVREPWGYGRWLDQIERYWSEPTFRLEGAFPWLAEANRLLNANETVQLERLLLGLAWHQLDRAGEGHYFDLEAVTIYVLKWNIIDRWTTYSGEEAVKRFNEIVANGLGEYTNVFH